MASKRSDACSPGSAGDALRNARKAAATMPRANADSTTCRPLPEFKLLTATPPPCERVSGSTSLR